MVAPTWHLMSSPMIGSRRSSNRRRHGAREAMKTGMQLTKAQPASRACSAYQRRRLLASPPAGSRPARRSRSRADVRRRRRRRRPIPRRSLQVAAQPVQGRAAAGRRRPSGGTSAKRMVLLGSAQMASARSRPTLPASTSKAADELDVADVVAAQLDVHQARDARRPARRRGRSGRPGRATRRSCRRPTIATFTVLRAIPPLPRAAPGPPTRASTKRNTRAAVGFR